jgi:hypothetical protein
MERNVTSYRLYYYYYSPCWNILSNILVSASHFYLFVWQKYIIKEAFYKAKSINDIKIDLVWVSLCPTCKNTGFILGTDEIDHTEKMFIEECPDCNS